MQPQIQAFIGKELGGYRIVEMIGTGGTGVVFRAVSVRHPADQVAIKILILPWQATQADIAAFRARFRREAETVRHLQHPHIVPILDLGEVDGIMYMILPFKVGGTLAGLVQRDGPLPLDRIARILSQIAAAVDVAHQAGIIHRDIKPGNILLDHDGNSALADFGIVRLLDDNATTLTGTGQIVGTPYYMAPEQVGAKGVTPASDIYSLGMVIFELLTGRPAYKGATPLEVMMQQVNDPLPAPSSLRPDLPPALDAVMAKVLAKAPAERFETAGAFVGAFNVAIRLPSQLMVQTIVPASPASRVAMAVPYAQVDQNTAQTLTGGAGASATMVPLRGNQPHLAAVNAFAAPPSHRLRSIILVGLALLVVASSLFIVLRLPRGDSGRAKSLGTNSDGSSIVLHGTSGPSSPTTGTVDSATKIAGNGFDPGATLTASAMATNPPVGAATQLPGGAATPMPLSTKTAVPPGVTPPPNTVVVPTSTLPPPTGVPPTATVPAATSVPPTATVPAATLVPPTATLVLPTATPIPPTSTSIPPTPTALPGLQLLANPSFEGFSNWCVWNNDNRSLVGCNGSYYYFNEEGSPGTPVDGSRYGYIWDPNYDRNVSVFQLVTAPQSGYYYASIYGFGNGYLYSKELYVRDSTNGNESGRTLVNNTSGFSYFTAGPLYVPAGHAVSIQIHGYNKATYVFRFDLAKLCFNYTASSCV